MRSAATPLCMEWFIALGMGYVGARLDQACVFPYLCRDGSSKYKYPFPTLPVGGPTLGCEIKRIQ